MLKKQSNLKRLLGYAGRHRYLSYASWVLSAASALVALVPYVFVWRIMQAVLAAAPDFSRAQGLVRNGWLAVLFAGIAVLIYIAGLMCSHMGAFRVATNLRIEAMRHIVKLPLGAAEAFGSGRLRKIVNESSAATETYLAHQLPDRAGAIATPCGLLALLLAFDWRLGLLSLVPVVLAFAVLMAHDRRAHAAEDEGVPGRAGRHVQRGGGVHPRHPRGQDLWADHLHVQEVQGRHRPLPGLGHRLHKGAAPAHDAVHRGGQRRFRLPDRGRAALHPQRRHAGVPVGPDLLHPHHAHSSRSR